MTVPEVSKAAGLLLEKPPHQYDKINGRMANSLMKREMKKKSNATI